MASSYSTDLKLELMVTGEKAGLWGDITNTNLVIIQQAIAGYESVALNATTGATLAFTNGAVSNGKNAVIELTGTITGNVDVTVPSTVTNKVYIIKNSTSGAHTVTVLVSGQTGVTFSATDKGYKTLYINGTDLVEQTVDTANLEDDAVTTAKILDANVTNAKLANSSFTLNGVTATLGSTINIVAGTDWQAVKTTTFNAVSSEGYFVNTNGGTFTGTLPGSPALGDEIAFIDYAGTFDTNNFTVGRNGNPIQGAASDLVVNTERAAFTLVYVDGTQGWLLKNN
jgi:hypothetical protein